MSEPAPPYPQAGWIEVIAGSMYSGKTEELIRRLRRAQIARQKVEIFKPAIDDRYARDHIVSHSELRIPSRSITRAREILRHAHEAQVIGIDEAQFLGEDLVAVCEQLARRGKRVIVAGLDQDYAGRPFQPMPDLLAVAEYITKTLAICVVCGAPANRTYRKLKRGGRVVVGGSELYEARCRRCYELGPRARPPQAADVRAAERPSRRSGDGKRRTGGRRGQPARPARSRARSRLSALASIAVLSVLLGAPGCARKAERTPQPTSAFRVGLVFDVGGRGDKSFNDAAYAGLERAKRELGIDFTTLETGEGTDREPAMRQLAAGGANLVFGVGFLFTDDIKRLAQEFPNTRFACVDYTVTEGETLPPNLVALKFREEEGSYLVGALAARLSRSNTLGFVGGMEIPLIKKFEAGYRAGIKAVRPDARVIVKYAGTTGNAFKDPTKGKELALAEYHQGADIIFHASGSTGLGVFEAARELDKMAIGVDSDQYEEAPGHVLTSMIKRVDEAVFDTIRDAAAGKWQSGVRVFGLAEKGVGWVYDGRNQALIPGDVKATVDSLEREIVAGRIQVPSQ